MTGPAYSKNMLLQITGAASNAYYSDSPGSYRVYSGSYTLQCIYGGQVSLPILPCVGELLILVECGSYHVWLPKWKWGEF